MYAHCTLKSSMLPILIECALNKYALTGVPAVVMIVGIIGDALGMVCIVSLLIAMYEAPVSSIISVSMLLIFTEMNFRFSEYGLL